MVIHAFSKSDAKAEIKIVEIQEIGAKRTSRRKLHDQIKTLLAGRDSTRIDHLHLIGLEKIRDHFGDDWDRVAPKGLKIAEGILRAHLVATDIVVALGNLGYLILFNKLSKNEADIKAAMIAAGIANRLMGGIQDAQEVVTVSVSETVDGGVLIAEKSVIDVVDDLVANETAIASNTSTIPDNGHNELAWTEDREPAVSRENLAQMHENNNHRQLRSDIRFTYKPMWDVSRKVLSTYRCVAVLNDSYGKTASVYDVLSGADSEDTFTGLDLMTLQTVIKVLEDLHSRGRRILMVSPVHYRTLQRINDFTRLKVFCQSMSDVIRRDIIFELVGIPDLISQRSEMELVSGLKNMGRSVIVPARLNRTHFEELHSRGLDTVATDIGDFEGNETEIMQMMDAFSLGAAQVNLKTVAYGLNTLSLATMAVAAGFDYVGGSAIHDIVDNPEHVFRFQSEDLFAKLMG